MAFLLSDGNKASMAESVTRHALISLAEKFQYLICGIDSLDLGLNVQWNENWPETVINLQDKKDEAQGNNGILDKTCTDSEFLHLPSGKAPNYRFHLKFAEYELYLAISETFGHSPTFTSPFTRKASGTREFTKYLN